MKNSVFNEICVSFTSEYCSSAITEALLRSCGEQESVALVFIGTDSNVGDSLAPLAGSLTNGGGEAGAFVYGNLNCPITAADVPYVSAYIKNAHPQSKIIVVDAAVGKKEDVGNVKVMQKSIRPGLGVNKILPPIGDVSVIGVVAERSQNKLSLLGSAKVSQVYAMAKVIADGINGFISAKAAKKGEKTA